MLVFMVYILITFWKKKVHVFHIYIENYVFFLLYAYYKNYYIIFLYFSILFMRKIINITTILYVYLRVCGKMKTVFFVYYNKYYLLKCHTIIYNIVLEEYRKKKTDFHFGLTLDIEFFRI